jgi:hypothetical protein
VEEILALDKKWKNFTQVQYDGLLLEDEKVDDMKIATDDILVVELPKGTDEWILQSEQDKTKDSSDVLQSIYSNQVKSVEELSKMDI